MSVVERNGNHYAVVYVDGKARWIACGKSRKKAQALHDEFIVKARRGELVIPKAITLTDFSELWMHDYCALTLKPVTIAEYKGYLKKYLKPAFGRMKMSAIRNDHVQSYVAGLVREGRLSAKSIRNQIVPLRRMFEVAIRWGYANANPAKGLALPRLEHEEMAFLTPAQMRLLIENTEPAWRSLIALGCMCGLRKGECLGLTWDSLSWEDHTIHVRRSLWGGVLQEPKTKKSSAKLPMPATVEALLFERMTISPASAMDLVFCRDDGSPLRPDYVNRGILDPALKAAGLPRVTFHALRHSFVAAHIAQGTPVKTIQELARHSSIQTTLDRYGHLQPEAKGDAARALDEAIFG
jgi:integrase